MIYIPVLTDRRQYFHDWVHRKIDEIRFEHDDWEYKISMNRLRIKETTYFYVVDEITIRGYRFTSYLTVQPQTNYQLRDLVDQKAKSHSYLKELE